MRQFLENLFADFSAFDWAALGAVLLVIESILEKTFGVKVVGRVILGWIRRAARFVVFGWILLPFKPQLDTIRAFFRGSKEIETKLLEVFQSDETQRETLQHISLTLTEIETEIKTPSGESLKAAVLELRQQENDQNKQLDALLQQHELVQLRLDINDDLNKRMTFRLTMELECVFVSDCFLETFGWAREDIKGFNWEIAIAPRSQGAAKRKWNYARKHHSRFYNKQFLVDKHGNEHATLVRGYPIASGFFGTVEILENPDELDDELTGKSFWENRKLPGEK